MPPDQEDVKAVPRTDSGRLGAGGEGGFGGGA